MTGLTVLDRLCRGGLTGAPAAVAAFVLVACGGSARALPSSPTATARLFATALVAGRTHAAVALVDPRSNLLDELVRENAGDPNGGRRRLVGRPSRRGDTFTYRYLSVSAGVAPGSQAVEHGTLVVATKHGARGWYVSSFDFHPGPVTFRNLGGTPRGRAVATASCLRRRGWHVISVDALRDGVFDVAALDAGRGATVDVYVFPSASVARRWTSGSRAVIARRGTVGTAWVPRPTRAERRVVAGCSRERDVRRRTGSALRRPRVHDSVELN